MSLTSRERIIAALEHQEADRVPIWESFWLTTLDRWRKEGLSEQAAADPISYFGLDPTCKVRIDWSLQFPTETIEETDEFIITRTNNGTIAKNFKGYNSTPMWSDFPLKDRASWEELKPRMLWNESRVNLETAKADCEAKKGLFRIYEYSSIGFEKFKHLMGMEGILLALAEDPEWVREMCMSTAELAINGLECLMGKGFSFDAAVVGEDMGYRGKAFFSSRTYQEVIMPCQQRYYEFYHAHRMKVLLHSCGHNMELVPLYVEAGIDCLNPLEVKAGNDIFRLKQEFGDVLALWGGIDVRAIAHPDPAVLEAEIAEKVPMASKGGGYILASDHSIPPDVSLERYQRMVEVGRRYGAFS